MNIITIWHMKRIRSIYQHMIDRECVCSIDFNRYKKGKKPNNAEYKKLQHILYTMRTTLLGYMIRFGIFHNITSYSFYLKRFQFMYSRNNAYPSSACIFYVLWISFLNSTANGPNSIF